MAVDLRAGRPRTGLGASAVIVGLVLLNLIGIVALITLAIR